MKKSKIKQEFEILNSAISSLAARVKELEGNTKQINEPLNELPEKWCVKDFKAVSDWYYKKYGLYSDFESGVSYLHSGDGVQEYFLLKYILKGYTEISFSAFERLVLKKGELEVGKWYKYELANALACYSGSFNDYGFVYNKWCLKGIQISDIPNWKPATKEEVESALIEEAKRRGYKPNENLFYYDVLFNILYDRYGVGRQIIFNNGQWATIVEEPKQEIDWSVPGQLVCNENGAIWLTSGKHNEDKFYATLIVSKSGNPKGRYSEKVSKEDMIGLYKDSITLSNEPI